MTTNSYTSIEVDSPATAAVAVAPNDSTPVGDALPRGYYVGGTGNITGRMWGSDTDVVFQNVPSGVILPVRFEIVKSTGTTATNIIALY